MQIGEVCRFIQPVRSDWNGQNREAYWQQIMHLLNSVADEEHLESDLNYNEYLSLTSRTAEFVEAGDLSGAAQLLHKILARSPTMTRQ